MSKNKIKKSVKRAAKDLLRTARANNDQDMAARAQRTLHGEK